MLRLLTVVGARPQFIKASVVSKELAAHPTVRESIVHTGQHFDENMSDVFFEQLAIPRPEYHLNIHGGAHGEMTGRMLIDIERILKVAKPDRVLVYGDTNSTLAGALAAAKLHIPVAHVEAGLRSFNRKMPEEINRILTDQLSDILFCPTTRAKSNLENEGYLNGKADLLQVGDVMQDSAIFFREKSDDRVLERIGYERFILATIHRAENTDNLERLTEIIDALNEIDRTVAPVVLPVHPRAKRAIQNLEMECKAKLIDPVGYLEMLALLKHCSLVLTDSGGLQKEAFFFGKACVTLRDETEWIELVEEGVNTLAGANKEKIIKAAKSNFERKILDRKELYGGGAAAGRIAQYLAKL